MKANSLLLALTNSVAVFCGLVALPASAQPAIYAQTPVYQPLSASQLDTLLGPIALYPDPLLAQILPASAYPAQIVMADRYLAGGGDPNLAYTQPWDPSVQALTHYPSVLRYLDDNLAWTTDVGLAFVNQQADVMQSIQRLRLSAYNFGNLVSTPQDEVLFANGDVEILPAQPDVVYVPVYQPTYIYCQAGYGISFGASCYLGSWLDCDFDWNRHQLYWWHGQDRDARWWHQDWAHRESGSRIQVEAWTPGHHENHFRANVGERQNSQNSRGYASEHNNVTVNNIFSQPGASPRPAATLRAPAEPRAAAQRTSGAFQLGNAYVENSRTPEDHGVQNGGYNYSRPEVSGNAGNTPSRSYENNNEYRGHAEMPQFPARHESAPEPARSEAPHSQPTVSHAAPAVQSGGNSGGESHANSSASIFPTQSRH